jgi:hypothetical protein
MYQSNQLQPYSYGDDDHEDGQVIPVYDPPEGHIIDEVGRLLTDPNAQIDPELLPEDNFEAYISLWQPPMISAEKDWGWGSKIVWSDVPRVVVMKRLDVYEQQIPRLQIGTTNIEESRSLRASGKFYPVHTIFCVDFENEATLQLAIESAGPPRRSRFRPINKNNNRDTTSWIEIEKLSVFHIVSGAPGSVQFYVDYQDFPDRYYLTTDLNPAIGCRRTFQFGAYGATQYFILEKLVQHEKLDIEGGKGLTYIIEPGPILYARKDYRLIGSFYGFHAKLPGSSLYTVYQRKDPFPRMIISMSVIERSEEWNDDIKFYAFDVPVPGTAKYSIQHCIRSIYSNGASIPRHRMTTDDPRNPWEFRMYMYTFPADIQDCTIIPFPMTGFGEDMYLG